MKTMINSAEQIIAKIPVGQSRQIVLIDVAGRKDISLEESNANVYCIDDRGEVIWQINAPPSNMGRDSFVSLRQTSEGLRADRFFGGEFIVDTLSGIASEVGWHK